MKKLFTFVLYFCAIITVAASIGTAVRHSPVFLVFYLPLIVLPLILLFISLFLTRINILHLILLIAPLGSALGCILICNSPTNNADGEVMGYSFLSAFWGIICTPFCLIPFIISAFSYKRNHPPIPTTMNPLTFRRATPFDLTALRHLYDEIIDGMEGAASHAQWKRGGYPTDSFLQTKAALGELWVAEKNGDMVAAMVLNSECNPGYAQATWQVDCHPEEVMAIHTLGVSPRVQGEGVGRAMVHKAIDIARKQGCKSIRLDVIDTNPAACIFYEKLGFRRLGDFVLDYPGAVCTTFTLCELPLVDSQQN